MQEKLEKAWRLFDSGAFDAAETVYLDCYRQTDSANREVYASILMGLIYVESFLEKFDEARKYAEVLVKMANSDTERHIAIHQYGMLERMAENYSEAKMLFQQEEELIRRVFADNDLVLSANLYEQAYIEMKTGNIALAEKIMQLSLNHAIKAEDGVCMGCAYRGMGEIMKRSNIEQAKCWFYKAIEAFSEAGDLIAAEEVKKLL